MKTKKVNIYLDPKMDNKLSQMSKSFKVSKSTIVDSLYIYFWRETQKYIQEKYLFENAPKNKKTSIKPKLDMWPKEIDESKTNMVLTNLVYLLVYDKFGDYITEERKNHLKKVFYAHLQKTKESYYNYNELLRNNVRMAKDKKFMAYMEKLNARERQKKNG